MEHSGDRKRRRPGAAPGTGARDRRRLAVRAAALVAAVALLLAGVPALEAQSYPTKPVRFIMPFSPGGGTDILGRIVGQKFAEQLGQPFVADNRPGAGGNIGAEVVAKAAPDGYTLLFASPALVTSPGFYKNLGYDALRDLAPVSMVMQGPFVLLVHPSLPVKTLREFIDHAKANPGKLNFGAAIGTPPHLSGALFNSLAGTKIVHVPYKAVVQAMIGLMSHEVDMAIISASAALPQIQAGKVRALAVLSEKRVPSLPSVPTTREAGVENFVVTSWYGVLATGGTPRPVIDRLHAEWVKIAAMPDTKEKLHKVDYEPMVTTPEQFGDFLKNEIARWTRVIREANLKLQ